MPVAEGRNIHYSPVDNKPLCSYSSKLCRQRRLNGYGFCIRHILEDKSAPFKQCDYVTRNKSEKCLNAIPTNQERGYCHSHMQVAGIIPKTERKIKPPPTPPNNPPSTPKPKPEKKATPTKPQPSPTAPPTPKPKSKKKPKPKPAVPPPPTTPSDPPSPWNLLNGKIEKEKDSPFEQLKTLKILEKLPSRLGDSPPICPTKNGVPPRRLEEENGKKSETRAEFLVRARSRFRSELDRVRDVVRAREKEEVRISVALRESLLSCVLKDPKRCAHILLNGEDELDMKKGAAGKTSKKAPAKPKKKEVKAVAVKPENPETPELAPTTNGKKAKPKAKKKKAVKDELGVEMPSPAPRKRVKSGDDERKKKKRRVDDKAAAPFHALHPNLTLNATAAHHNFLPFPSHLSAGTQLQSVLGSVTSSSGTSPEPVDTPFDSPFHHSGSSHQEVDFCEEVDDLEKSFELHIDPEIAHQASRLLEENELTEDDFNELFPETRSLSDHKLGSDLGLDFTSNFDPSDIDYSLFANIFPNFRPPPSQDSIQLSNNF